MSGPDGLPGADPASNPPASASATGLPIRPEVHARCRAHARIRRQLSSQPRKSSLSLARMALIALDTSDSAFHAVAQEASRCVLRNGRCSDDQEAVG